MKTVNRTAIHILPRQPFLDWLKQIDPACPGDSAELLEDSTIYLIPETDTPEAARTWMRRHFDTIFTEELESWYTDESLWPAPRNFTLFEAWFSWTAHSLVQDLAKIPLRHEDA